MKRTTCSLIIGTMITGLVVFLLGFDIASKRRKASSLVSKDNKKVSKVSDMQILSLIDKRIEKLENALNDFIKKTNDESKAKKSEIPKKYINIGESRDEIKKNLSGNSENKLMPWLPFSDFYAPKKEKDVLPMISESSSKSVYSSYKETLPDHLSNDIKEIPMYLKGLINNFSFDKMNWPLLNESQPLKKDEKEYLVRKDEKEHLVRKDENEHLVSKDEKEQSTRKDEKDKMSKMLDEKNKSLNMVNEKDKLPKMSNDKQEKREIVNLGSQKSLDKENDNDNKLEMKVKKDLQKPKTPGFIEKSLDEAVTPTDNIPNLTDFSSQGTNYHPIFFTKENKLPQSEAFKTESKTLPFTNAPSIERIEGLTNNDMEEKKSRIPSEDQKAITDAIDNIFSKDFKTSHNDKNSKDIKYEEPNIQKKINNDMHKSKDMPIFENSLNKSEAKRLNSIIDDNLSVNKKDEHDKYSPMDFHVTKKSNNKKKALKNKKKSSDTPKIVKMQGKSSDTKKESSLNSKNKERKATFKNLKNDNSSPEAIQEKLIQDLYNKEYYVVPKDQKSVKEPESLEFKMIKSTIDDMKNNPVFENEEEKGNSFNAGNDRIDELPLEVNIKL